jgi:AcrR family transcriptional regulator
MARRTERQEARREQILNGAARVFSKKGYHASTVDEIAKELGLTKASIYYYVSDKSDLLYQLYKRAMTMLLGVAGGNHGASRPARRETASDDRRVCAHCGRGDRDV